MYVLCVTSVQSEPDGFASFHLYVCAAFLTRFSRDLQRERDFHVSCTLLMFLPVTHALSTVQFNIEQRLQNYANCGYMVYNNNNNYYQKYKK